MVISPVDVEIISTDSLTDMQILLCLWRRAVRYLFTFSISLRIRKIKHYAVDQVWNAEPERIFRL